ncbi:MAG: hypothetical protein JXO22_17495, partial [Phycisphaerae bacterium]|nr:hypothetical protein [Phycisphaerae bacterium]
MLRSAVLTTWAASCLLLASCTPARAQIVLFQDDFDAGTSAGNWSVLSHAGDYTANFAFDYSTRGIPSAPNSTGGSTVGLHFTVNNNDQTPAKDAVSAYPVGQSFSGDYTLKFDMWINYNGGAGGGTGSTEFVSAGINHSGSQVCWPDNAASDGFWFACDGEGGVTDDYVV